MNFLRLQKMFQHPTTLYSFQEEAFSNGHHRLRRQGNLFSAAGITLCRTDRGLVAVCLTLDTDEFFTEVRGKTLTGIAVDADFSSAVELYRLNKLLKHSR